MTRALDDAQAHVHRCTDILTVVSLALDGDAGAIGPCEIEAVSTVVRCALDEAKAARACLSQTPQPQDQP